MTLGIRISTVALHMMEPFDPIGEPFYCERYEKKILNIKYRSAVLEAENKGKVQMLDGNIINKCIELTD